mgnify:CR=1 FL=1
MLDAGNTKNETELAPALMELAFQFERKMIKHAISIKWEKFYNRGCTEG